MPRPLRRLAIAGGAALFVARRLPLPPLWPPPSSGAAFLGVSVPRLSAPIAAGSAALQLRHLALGVWAAESDHGSCGATTRAVSSGHGMVGAGAEAGVTFLNQEQAQQVDVDLMSAEGGFSIDQLMELAGLSVAASLAKEYPVASHSRVLIVCGPGNNGGDGLVAARHLHHFGYRPSVVYPKMEAITAKNELYKRLTIQLAQLGVPVAREWTRPGEGEFDVVIDAVFGFSFKGWRGEGKDAPFDNVIDFLAAEEGGSPTFSAPVVSVDIPSGWDVEKGPPPGKALRPDMLVSLTAPKLCSTGFKGRFHYLGGRFVPPNIIEKNGLRLPAYPGAEQCVRLAAL